MPGAGEVSGILGCLALYSPSSQALVLLSRNVADHPESASARFGLGRALRTAGRAAEAREAFERALAIDPEHSRAQSALEALDEGGR